MEQSEAWFIELEQSAARRREVETAVYMDNLALDGIEKSLTAELTVQDKEINLRRNEPMIYGQYLKELNRLDEVKEMYDGRATYENYTWYLNLELFPKIGKMRAEGKLYKGKDLRLSHSCVYR